VSEAAESAGLIDERAGDSLFGGGEGGDEGDTSSGGVGGVGGASPKYEAEWLESFEGGKYQTISAAQEAFGGLRRGLTAAQQKLKGFTGPPMTEDGQPGAYEFEVPEGVNAKIDTDNPMFTKLQEWGHKHGMSQEAAQELFAEVYAPSLAAEVGADKDAEMAFLTDHYQSAEVAQQRVAEVFDWASELVGEENIGVLKAVGRTADGILCLDILRSAFQNVTIPSDTIGSGGGMNDAKVQEIMSQHGWEHTAQAAQVYHHLNQKAG